MGWLEDIAGIAINPLALAAPILGGKAYSDAHKPAETKKPDAPPAINPQYQQLFDEQQKSAKDFRNNIPRLADTFMGQVAEVNKKNLASEIDHTQKNYNQRGLLYSTARQGAEGADRTAAAQDLAQKRSEVNSQLYDQADQMDQNAIDTGFGIANQGQQKNQAQTELEGKALELAMQKQLRDSQALSGAFKAGGEGLGYAGGLLSNRQNGVGNAGAGNPSSYTSPSAPKSGQVPYRPY